MTAAWVVAVLLGAGLTFVLVAAEEALLRMSPSRAEELADEGRTGARSLVRVVADRAPYLAVLVVVRCLAYAATALGLGLSVHLLAGEGAVALVGAIAAVGLGAFLFAEVSPRAFGRSYYDVLAPLAAPFTVGLRTVLGPVATALVLVANAVTPGSGERNGPFDTEAELRDLVDLAEENQLIEDDERDMIHSVFELSDTTAREVMVPRIDMETIALGKSLRQASALFVRSGYSRVPVVGDDSDDIRGVLYLKDVVRATHADAGAAARPITEVMRPAVFVPESKKVDDLLREMQRDQNHIAVVVDEYGGTAGLVTIEDILEEIVGEISDEYDRDTTGIEPLGDGRLRVPAGMAIDDLADLFAVGIDEDEVDTVGGLLTKAIGQVPQPGSRAEVAGLLLTAERMAGRRHRLATVLVEPVSTAASPRRTEGDLDA
ncbi:MAG: HlyC/CorC family transporter [Actinomycetales bacterium]|nr:HlyC/CorC family transporter [Candidatus Lutibacillus vidarii]